MSETIIDYKTFLKNNKGLTVTYEKLIDTFSKTPNKTQVKDIHIDKELEEYIVDIIFATRKPSDYGLDEIEDLLEFGASPRATIDMFKAVKAMAYLRGKDYVTPVDVAYIAHEIMRHRIVLTYEAEAEGITSDEIIQKVLETVAIP